MVFGPLQTIVLQPQLYEYAADQVCGLTKAHLKSAEGI